VALVAVAEAAEEDLEAALVAAVEEVSAYTFYMIENCRFRLGTSRVC